MTTGDLPHMQDDPTLERLEPAVRRVWSFKLAIAGAVAFVPAVGYDVLNLFDPERALPLGLATVTVALGFSVAAWGIPRLRYRYWGFRLTEEELVIQRGILNRIRTVVPLRRVQHLDVSQDLIEREYSLGKLIVHTAGSRSSEVVLPGLLFDRAERLREHIRAYITDEPV